MFGWLKGEKRTVDDLPRIHRETPIPAAPPPIPAAPVVPTAPAPKTETISEVEAVVPIVEEEVTLGKRTVPGDLVRVEVTTETDLHTLSEELRSDTIDVKRVPVDKTVETRPTVRRDGATTIIPVVRERLVLKTELVLTEEIHITRHRETQTVEREVELRHQTAHVTRTRGDR
jgi:stress response protein YsnF